jgi:hypothetical protein
MAGAFLQWLVEGMLMRRIPYRIRSCQFALNGACLDPSMLIVQSFQRCLTKGIGLCMHSGHVLPDRKSGEGRGPGRGSWEGAHALCNGKCQNANRDRHIHYQSIESNFW